MMNMNLNRSRLDESNYMSHQYGLGSHGGSHHNLSQSQASEPMHHSPISSVSERDRISYLPCYLMGDPAKSPKLRKDASMTPNLDLSGIAGSGGMANISGGGGGAGSGQTSPLIPTSTISSTMNSTSPFNMSSAHPQATPPRAKSTGPPKHGLGHSSINTSTSTSTMKSPSQDALQHGNWVTIFGFQPASQQFVLQNFSALGSIVDYKTTPGCNWIHVKYSNTIEARKALSKNGGIIGGNLMIGVIKTETPFPITNNDNVLKTRIRPLANDNLANQVPVRETGIMSKVTEFLGW